MVASTLIGSIVWGHVLTYWIYPKTAATAATTMTYGVPTLAKPFAWESGSCIYGVWNGWILYPYWKAAFGHVRQVPRVIWK